MRKDQRDGSTDPQKKQLFKICCTLHFSMFKNSSTKVTHLNISSKTQILDAYKPFTLLTFVYTAIQLSPLIVLLLCQCASCGYFLGCSYFTI